MIDWISARPTELKNPHTLLKKPHSIVYVLAYDLKSNWTTRSLRTADAFPVVGREATTGNASAVRRLDHSYFTSQVVCLIWLTAVSFDRLIEPHVINVTTIVDGKK